MPACAPDGTPAGQRRLRETGSGAKTGQEHAPRVREPVVSRIPEANRAFCSLSLGTRTIRLGIAGVCPAEPGLLHVRAT